MEGEPAPEPAADEGFWNTIPGTLLAAFLICVGIAIFGTVRTMVVANESFGHSAGVGAAAGVVVFVVFCLVAWVKEPRRARSDARSD